MPLASDETGVLGLQDVIRHAGEPPCGSTAIHPFAMRRLPMQQELRKRTPDRHAHTGHPAIPRAPHCPLRVIPMALLMGGLLLFSVAVAQAQPANDDIANATPITTLPFTDGPVDTTLATTAADDPDCAGNGRTVWYVFTPTENFTLLVNAGNESYDNTLSVYTGSPGALTQIACEDYPQVVFDVTAGTTYYFMIGSWFSDQGGTFTFHAEVAPPQLQIDLTVSGQGTVKPSTGIATIRGTVICNTSATFEVYGTLQQKVGRSIISGGFGAGRLTCTPPATPWQVAVTGAAFVSGQATLVNLSAFACNTVFCDDAYIPGPITVELKSKPK